MTFRNLREITVGILLLAGTLWGQAPARPEFDVASIQPSQPSGPMAQRMAQGRLGMRVEGNRVSIGSLSVYDMIRIAYRAKSYQVVDLNFFRADRWDVQAIIPEGGSRDQVPEMLRTLLEERFKLQVHKQSKEQSGYALVMARVVAKDGPKLKEAARDTASSIGDGTFSSPLGPIRTTMPNSPGGAGKLEFAKIGMAALADLLSPLMDKPVIDMTGLQGDYQVSLDLDSESLAAMMIAAAGIGINQAGLPGDVADSSGSSVANAVQQLGLRLEPRKLPVETIIVDHLEKTPTAN
jgi:uncharacterized protein (TIGR03435 family)